MKPIKRCGKYFKWIAGSRRKRKSSPIVPRDERMKALWVLKKIIAKLPWLEDRSKWRHHRKRWETKFKRKVNELSAKTNWPII